MNRPSGVSDSKYVVSRDSLLIDHVMRRMRSVEKSLSTATSICFQHCEGPKSLPSPPVTSFPPIRLPFFSPLRSSPLNPTRGSGERCKLSQWCLGRSPSRQRFWCILRVKERCWWHSRCTVSNNRKRLFLTFYEEIFKRRLCDK